MMPDGRAVQMGTSHHLGQNFSKKFEIRFLGEDSALHFVWQTSWGISWRLIGALVMQHGDDKGLVLPPRVAPIQVAIIPIIFSSSKSGDVLAKCNEIADQLSAKGVRVFLDSRENYTPGWKFNEWELKGVPLRIEIGPRDIANDTCVFVRRDLGNKESVPLSRVTEMASQRLEEIQSSLFAKAKDRLKTQTSIAGSYEELRQTIESTGGFVRAGWCGSQKCEIKVKDETGSDIRLIPFDEQIDTNSKCVVCGSNATQIAYFARAY